MTFTCSVKDYQTVGNTFTTVYRDTVEYCVQEDFITGKNLDHHRQLSQALAVVTNDSAT